MHAAVLLALEYVRFLRLKLLAGDENAELLSPSALVDSAWHYHVLAIGKLDHELESAHKLPHVCRRHASLRG